MADRVIRHVDAGNPEKAARGFIDYWTGPGGYESMTDELQESVTKGMAKVRHEWDSAFKPCRAPIERLERLSFPIQLIAWTRTTAAGVTAILREISPMARYAEIEGAGYMSPVSHASLVNPIIAEFVSE